MAAPMPFEAPVTIATFFHPTLSCFFSRDHRGAGSGGTGIGMSVAIFQPRVVLIQSSTMIQGLGTGSRDLEAGVDERNGDRYVSCLHTVPADVLAEEDSAVDIAAASEGADLGTSAWRG